MSDTFQPKDIIGDFEVIRKIGEGAAGEVFLVQHRFLDYISAMKVVVSHDVFANPVMKERFFREARIAAVIRHPNIVEVSNVSQIDELDISYIIMEYVEGESLFDYMQTHETAPFDMVLDVASAIGEAIEVISEHGVVHRDIKPSNILLTKSGMVKLADLGIAKVTGKGRLNDIVSHSVTSDTVLIGTPSYSAPEQCLNANRVDVRSDIYSLGMCLYEMLAGKVPFQSEDPMLLVEEVLYKEIPQLRKINPDIPEALSDFVMKMIAREPGLRFQTPEELLEAIDKVRKKLHPGTLEKGKELCRKQLKSSPKILLIAGIVLFIGAAVALAVQTTWSTWNHLRESRRLKKLSVQRVSSGMADVAEDGVLFSGNREILKRYSPGRTGKSYTLPVTVKKIASGAFRDCKSLQHVVIPPSVTEIGDEAFFNCTSLKRIDIPEGEIRIGKNVFNGCPLGEDESEGTASNVRH